ncbi:MAG: hypothetical protein EBY41_01430 [Proteobacteria bacterium]|nr:hypothetical protein [Pseudomonadota bacterium]
MALQTSGAISGSQIATEFSDSSPHSLSEFYRGGARVAPIPANNPIPTSGAIAYSNFYGTVGADSFSYTLSATAYNHNVRNHINSNFSYGGVKPAYVVITINSGIYIGGSSGNPAFRTGSMVGGSRIIVTNNGTIGGFAGGGGSPNGGAGGAGGHAIYLDYPLEIYNPGVVSGGGGGGGAGGQGRVTSPGSEDDPPTTSYYNGGAGGAGRAGWDSGAAIGGSAGGPNAGPGGAGGTRGNGGSAGTNGNNTNGGAGGARGNYEVKNGHTLTWHTAGTRLGGAS